MEVRVVYIGVLKDKSIFVKKKRYLKANSMKTQKEKMEIFSYDAAINALKIYKDLTKQLLPAAHHKDQKKIFDFNNSIEIKLEQLGS